MNRRTIVLAGLATLPVSTTALAKPKQRPARTKRAAQDANARRH